MKLFLRNYLLLILLSLLTLFSCVEESTTSSDNPSTPPLSIDYDISENFYIALINTNLLLKQKENFGSQARFSVSPTLPSGLSLDITNGNISGTPTTVSLPTPYTVTTTANSKTYTGAISFGVAPSRVWITNTNSTKPYELTAFVVGDGIQQTEVNWSSSNPSLATVSNGVVDFKPTTTGGATVIAASKNSYSNKVSFTVDKVEAVSGEKIITKGIDTHLVISSGTKSVAISQFRNKGITSVTFPDSVTNISGSAFHQNQLRNVVIPDSVLSIEEWAFRANRLTSLVIGNSVTSIGNYAFAENLLRSVVIPNSVTSIGAGAFRENQLPNVVIPNSVTSIGNYAFAENQLRSVLIPNSVRYIDKQVFDNNQLTNVVIGNSVTKIDYSAFYNNQLRSVVIPDSVTNVDEYVFTGNQLTNVVIGNSVTSIGNYAFSRNQLRSVVIPNSVTSIGQNAFARNPNLVEVSLKQSLYTKITNTSSANTVFGTQVTNYIKRP